MDQNWSEAVMKDDGEAVAKASIAFAAEDELNIATVDQRARHETGVISINPRLRRETQARFSELLLADCTHKTNRSVIAEKVTYLCDILKRFPYIQDVCMYVLTMHRLYTVQVQPPAVI